MPNPVTIINRIQALLKQAGIDIQKIIGTVDPNITKLVTKTEKTARKPKLIDILSQDKKTFGDALDIFKNDAKYLSQMDDMELVNFANNLEDYFKVGGKIKHTPSNVVTTEGTPVVGQKLEKLAERKGIKGKPDETSLQGAMEGLMSLVDELKGISPKMRKSMDRDELVEFIRKMRGKDFTNQEIKLIREYADEYSIGLAKKEAAPAMQYAKKLKAKTKDEFELIREYLDNVQTTSPKEFREMYGNVKSINMDLSNIMDAKLEKHFKKKYKWDKTKTDGGLDEVTFEKYEDELSQAEREFSDFHRVYDTDSPPGVFGTRKSTSFANHPKNYLDEASEKLQSITGEGLNVDFYKNYTDDVLTKYPKPESFASGGLAYMLGEPTYADGGRIGFKLGGIDKARRLFLEMMGGAAATGVAAKTGLLGFLKAGKPAAVETLTSVPIKNADGMPSWFKPLVNRVIQEGDDVTKQFAWKERQIVHSKKLGENQGVKVTQDLDDQTIRVEYQSADNMGGVDDAVNLEYKAAEEIPTKKGSVKTKPTFEANEAYPLQDPKDYKWITFEGDNTVSNVDGLYSDTSALKQFGTGKNLSKKESAIAKQKRERVKKINEAPDEELGPLIDYPTPDDFATGGRVPFALGRGTEQAIAENKALEEKIDFHKRATDFLNKLHDERAIRNAPEGVLMDPPPEPNWSLIEELKNPKDRGLMPIDNYVEYDDGTVFLKHEGKYYNQDGTQVDGPSKYARIIPRTYEAAEGGRVPLVKGKIVKGIMSLGKKKKIDDLGGSKADPFSPDFDMKAEADLIAKTPFTSVELKRLFGNQIDDNIIREIAAMDPAKQLKAIEDVKLYIRNRKNLKQELMLRDLDVTGLEPHASGGLAGMLGE